MKKTFAILAAIGLTAITVASCGQKSEAAAKKPPVVKGARVERVSMSPVEDYYEATGTVRSKTTTVLSSKIMGTIISLRAREGDKVSAGQVIVEIDNRDANAQLQKAKAGLRQAQEGLAEVEQAINAAKSAQAAAEANQRLADSTHARYQSLFERKSVSPQEFDEAKAKQEMAEAEARRADDTLKMLAAKRQQALAGIDQAKAEVANVQVFVSYARITSPISGVVVAKHTEVGSTATPGAPLLTIEDGSRYRLEAAVEESQLGKIGLGQRARVRIDALGADHLEGGVSEITPVADPMSRSYTVKIDLPAGQSLRSGLYGVARFASGRRQAILIPQKAVAQRGQLVGVFVVDDAGVARLRLIKTGKSYGDSVEALSGLSDGERIVVDDVTNVRDGEKVQ
ncbi:MAG TPA: efflux RND transporter periplasmic adaptor subunit [Blastocatellia bacterium]|nr:efflux RND transporter periplasmic adaptor subunit [Blastocatellia bacterium]